MEIIAKTLFGLEETLAIELNELGAKNIKILNRAVRFTGDLELVYLCNLRLRTALRILISIGDFNANNEDELYKKIKSIEWEKYFQTQNTFIIDANTSSDVFRNSKYVALKTKDAIADRFRDLYDKRPSVDTVNPDIYINLYIYATQVYVSIDSSGQSLDRRGYRLSKNEAPINEVLAAGIILLSNWKGETDFYDPMCGSGTFSIEAALIATNTAPGINRGFSFQNWSNFDNEIFENIKTNLTSKIVAPTIKIYARDISGTSLEITAENAERAGVDDYISLKNEDFFNSESKSEKGVIIFNPPYGERMTPSGILDFYKNIGNKLKLNFQGFDAFIISSNFEALKNIGLKPSSKKVLFNGALECKLQKYEMYQGTRRTEFLPKP
jgi:putative N6-adenine-specific DNA methylase